MSRGSIFVLGLGLGALTFPLWCELAQVLAKVNDRPTYAFGVR